VPRRAACHDYDAPDRRALLLREVQPVEARCPFGDEQPSTEGAPHGFGLLTDLLQHEVGIAAERDRVEIPFDIVDRPHLLPSLAVQHAVARRGHHGNVAVVEVNHRPGMSQHRARIGGHQVLPVPNAEEHRRAAPRDHDLAGIRLGDHREAVGPLDVVQGRDDPFFERRAGRLLDQMYQCLGIGLSHEAMAVLLQPLAEHVGVLDDAVVDQRHRPRAIDVGVCVALGRRAVRRPACMSDTAVPVHRPPSEQLAQAGDATGELAGLHPTTVLDRDPGGVVAPVFQAREPLNQNRHRLSRADVPHDSAHRSAALALEFQQRVTGNR